MTSNRNSIDSISTINVQDHQEQEDHYYNNYIPRSRACSSDLPADEIMEKIAEAYKANIAPMITQAAAMVIENALKNGMEPATIILGIEETGMASRPSPYYLRAVLRNWAERGVVTSRTRDIWKRTEAKPWWR